MGKASQAIGEIGGKLLFRHGFGGRLREFENQGSAITGVIGKHLSEYKLGGRVKGKLNKPVEAILHGQEYVVPAKIKIGKRILREVKKRNKKFK